MGSEGVTLRWTIWTNIPLRGEYAACCKNLVNLQLYGFCQGRRSPGRLKKKKVFPPPPPLHLSLPPSSHGKLFRLPYSLAPFRLYQYTQFKLNGHYLFIYDVTLVAGLYDTKGLLFRIPRLFLIGSNLWYPIYFRPHNGGYMFQASKSSCGFASTLPWSRWTDLLLIFSSLTILSIRRCVYAYVC